MLEVVESCLKTFQTPSSTFLFTMEMAETPPEHRKQVHSNFFLDKIIKCHTKISKKLIQILKKHACLMSIHLVIFKIVGYLNIYGSLIKAFPKYQVA